MRLKNIKGAMEYVENSDYVVHDLEKNKGKWNKLFENEENDIHLEIGMGRGKFIIEMAQNNTNINYIGLEMYDSVIYKAIKHLENLEKRPNNLILIRADANKIDEFFEKEISRIYLNFSDPWPKAKHAKRRLTSKQFLNKYDKIFKDNNEIFMKTDNDDLFEFSVQTLIEHGYKLENVTRDLYNNMNIVNVATEYEEKFVKQGITINRLEAYRNGDK